MDELEFQEAESNTADLVYVFFQILFGIHVINMRFQC